MRHTFSRARSRAPSSSAAESRARRCRTGSNSSRQKGRSVARKPETAWGTTRPRSTPWAFSCSSRPVRALVSRCRVDSGAAATLPTVSRPYSHRVREVAAPTPGSAATGCSSRKPATAPGSSGTTRVSPGPVPRRAMRANIGPGPSPDRTVDAVPRERPYPYQCGQFHGIPAEVPFGAPQVHQRAVGRQRLDDGREPLEHTDELGQGGLVDRRQLETYAEDGHPALPGLWCHNFLPLAGPSPAGRRSAHGCISYPVGQWTRRPPVEPPSPREPAPREPAGAPASLLGSASRRATPSSPSSRRSSIRSARFQAADPTTLRLRGPRRWTTPRTSRSQEWKTVWAHASWESSKKARSTRPVPSSRVVKMTRLPERPVDCTYS